MNSIFIEATEKSPKVILDVEKNVFQIEGNSRPENVRDFYYPIIDSLKEYFEGLSQKNLQANFEEFPIKFNFRLDYFNSSSAKFLSDVLVIIKKYSDLGFNIKVYWYFEEHDDDMKEVGEDFSDMITYPFSFIMVQR
jgi:hypothetical protein